MVPTDEDLGYERRYWQAMDQAEDYAAYIEAQAQLEDFSTWPLADLIEELKTVRMLTPDQLDVIEELVSEIEAREVAA